MTVLKRNFATTKSSYSRTDNISFADSKPDDRKLYEPVENHTHVNETVLHLIQFKTEFIDRTFRQ